MNGRIGLIAGLLAATLAWHAPAQAQIPGSGNSPVTIEADRGIEWHREQNIYVAIGNAKAVRGTVTVFADRLVAHYRAGADGAATDIYQVEAIGKVRIVTPSETATGDKGIYDVEKQVMVLTGKGLRFTTPKQTVTARDSLEYWEGRKVAVARGDAVAWEGERRVSADTLTAHLVEDAKTRNTRISKVDAFGKVRVSSSNEIATGSKGVYNLDTNIATLVGDVKVTQGRNQLNGEYAEVNMTTGVSRMLSGSAAGRTGQRVRGLLVPEQGSAPANTANEPARPTPAPRPRS